MTILPTRVATSWQARTCYVAAALFTLASGGTNLIYGWSKGTDTASSLVWAAVSVGVSIIFALSWPALILSLDRKQWARAAMVLVALVVTGIYSVSAALGSAMGGRMNAAATETATISTRQRAQAAYDQARAALAQLAPSRPLAEVEAVLAASKPTCRTTTLNGRRDLFCTPNAGLVAEKARAQRRAELQAQVDRASELLSEVPVHVANTDAKALQRYLGAAGMQIEADRLNDLLTLLAVIMIECGGGLALAVGMALSDGMRSGRSERADGQGERSGVNNANEQPSVHSERQGEKAGRINGFAHPIGLTERPERSAHERVLSALRAKDGVLFGSQGTLGASFGWSKTRMNEVLHELRAAGRVRLTVSQQGTAVRLVSA